ncbi:MAG TPA: MlaD family protein [Bacteroidales bacterium]|nr:MlaD family protein [Bacteroidales bacterium]
MKSLSNEVKVGIIAIITIVVFIWLYNFLKGKNLLNKDATYYAVYDKVGGLAESSPIEVNGYRVGVVQSIKFIDPVSGRLVVEFSVDKDFKLPKNTVAEIVPISVLGGMKVQFVYGEGPGFYDVMDTIPGRVAESLTDMLETELIPVKNKISHLVTEIDSVISSVNEIMNTSFKKDLGNTMSNISSTSDNIDEILNSKKKELKTTLDNITSFSDMLSRNTGKLDQTFGNLQNITDTLASADIYGTINHLRSSLENTNKMLDNLNNGQGSAGQLLTNDSLYNNLNESLQSLNLFLQDLKANPKRYVHFSVFGKNSDK